MLAFIFSYNVVFVTLSELPVSESRAQDRDVGSLLQGSRSGSHSTFIPFVTGGVVRKT